MNERYLMRKYGISIDEYQTINTEQCHICGINQASSKKRLAVDHCKENKVVRGILCSNCNTGLGLFRHLTENLEKAIDYLQKNANIPMKDFELPYHRNEGKNNPNFGQGWKQKKYWQNMSKEERLEISAKNSESALKQWINKREEMCKSMRKPKKESTCPICNFTGRGGNMVRYHFDNCKEKNG